VTSPVAACPSGGIPAAFAGYVVRELFNSWENNKSSDAAESPEIGGRVITSNLEQLFDARVKVGYNVINRKMAR
jgi:hypothetical protein